jgi:hypothetical protein
MQPQRNWRDLLKPQTLEGDAKSLTSTYGKFIGEPFERASARRSATPCGAYCCRRCKVPPSAH